MIKMEYCCKEMNHHLHNDSNNKLAILYSKKFRSYNINLKYSGAVQMMLYCPWCGTKLPENLDQKYNEELSKVLSIDVEDITLDTYLPEEFKTDEWWKKRDL